MEKKNLEKKYQQWIDLRGQHEKYISQDEGRITRILDRCDRLIKTPRGVTFLPQLLHKKAGITYGTYFNVVRGNINKSYDSLKNRIKRSIAYEVSKGNITAPKGRKLREKALSQVEAQREQRLSRFKSLDKRAQRLYNKSIEKIERWGKTGQLPPIERAIGAKYLPKKYQEAAHKYQDPINVAIAKRKAALGKTPIIGKTWQSIHGASTNTAGKKATKAEYEAIANGSKPASSVKGKVCPECDRVHTSLKQIRNHAERMKQIRARAERMKIYRKYFVPKKR